MKHIDNESSGENTTRENTTCVFPAIISINTQTEHPQTAGTHLERNNNETPTRKNLSLGFKSEEKTSDSSNHNHTPMVIKNDLEIISQKNSGNGFSFIPKYDISDLSNEQIAYFVKEKLNNNPIDGIDKRKYFFLTKLIEYSQGVEGSTLYQLFCNECKDRPDLIDKLDKQ